MYNVSENYHAPTELRIGHIHLNVFDLERSIAFYRDIMGFDLLFNFGTAAFLSVGGYHHHIGLNTWKCEAGEAPARTQVGLHHFALNYPTKRDLALALKRLREKNYPVDGASDHTSHIAVYLADPDGNGIELACDRDQNSWKLLLDQTLSVEQMRGLFEVIDLDDLLKEAG
ncbi:VOC family protein [Dyadobacter aurulentus]|uniref:VOC family protein n=1 Tax=Dyadobacter sp. UC 10 TaxID=2605428 RepID=UPI0011F2159B|nr:VOC family protein [Dyadobacter sp. UC 10]KAA0993372.1 glyoxalase [Dyadobacter sp. UC 10]